MKSEPFELFRNYIGLHQCIRCTATLEGAKHHMYCDKCWKRLKLERLARDIDIEAAMVIQKRNEEATEEKV